jgi:8-oxo-dGTP pyrophosphatase MutT (NUDIX family)
MKRAVGVFVFSKDRFLLLQRNKEKPQGGQWGLPAGKIDEGETPLAAAIRELFEETGIQVDTMEELGCGIWQFPGYALEFTSFRLTLSGEVSISLGHAEHAAYKWVTPAECLAMTDTVHGIHDHVREYFPPG